MSLRDDYATCQLWHVQPVSAAQRQPVTSAIPTLILAGEYDPATPPAYGIMAAHTLSRNSYFLFAGTGHGVVGRNSCATSMFLAFLERPTEKPDSTCMMGVGGTTLRVVCGLKRSTTEAVMAFYVQTL